MPFGFKKACFRGFLYLFPFLISIHSHHLLAQTIKVEKIDSRNGLSNDEIHDIHEDKYGYKWITTSHGLNKYDGLNFEVFRHDPQDTTSVRANSLGQIYEDNHGNLWITVDVGGVCRYDRASGKFSYYNYDSRNPSNRNNFPMHMAFDGKGRTWAGTNSGINLIIDEDHTFRPVEVNGHDQVNVLYIKETSDGSVWLTSEQGLFLFNEVDNQFEEVKSLEKRIEEPRYIFEDADKNLWVPTFDSQLYRLSLSDKKPENVKLPKSDKSRIINVFQNAGSSVMMSMSQEGIFEQVDGSWKSVPLNGIPKEEFRLAYSRQNNKEMLILSMGFFPYLMKRGEAARPLARESVNYTSFWLDQNDKAVWFGTRGLGLYKAVNQEYKFDKVTLPGRKVGDFPYSNFVSEIMESSDGSIYFVAAQGLFRLEPVSGNIEPQLLYGTQNLDFSINHMSDFGKEILLGTAEGFFLFDKSSKKIRRSRDFPRKGWVSQFTSDQQGNFVAVGRFGVVTKTAAADPVQYLIDSEGYPEMLSSVEPRTVLADRKGQMWVGTVREGIFRITKEDSSYSYKQFKYSGVKKTGFKSQTVNCIFEDSRGRLWVGGFSSGLMEFDRNTEQWINHTPEGSLPIPNIQSIEEASDGCIWISAIDGLHKYIPDQDVFKRYTYQEGLSSNTFLLHSSLHASDGKLYFGSNRGITVFDPMQLNDGEVDVKAQIEEIRLFDNPVKVDAPIQETKELTFRYTQNFIGFDFISINYTNPEDVVYTYMLEGIDEDWIYSDRTRTVNYASIPPGTYTFKVRAGLNSGNWGTEEASVMIHILSPFWKRTWFYLLVILFISSMLYLIHYLRVRQKIERLSFMESIRKKAAADFHDEMGNKLTRIALFSEVLERKLNGSQPETREYVEKIKHNSRNLNNSMRDFLWALDPKKDSAYDLASLLKDFGEELFDKTKTAFSVDQIPVTLNEVSLAMDWKRHLVMTFKEAMHNVLKHAKAHNVSLQFALKDQLLTITLKDDGKGFDIEQASDGYGLRNMRSRISELKSTLHIVSEPGIGTTIIFEGSPSNQHQNI